MSFRDFSGINCSENSSGAKMVADSLYNCKPHGAMNYPLQMAHLTSPQLLCDSSPLSLALQPKLDSLGEIGLIGKSFDSSLMGKSRKDDFENRSGSENFESASGDDQDSPENKAEKRKKYHRHSPIQIQELEASFKENPHPDEKSRIELGKRLGLVVRQIKFWFQNRRTQIKTQLERHENSILKEENDKLHFENITLKEAMRNPICNTCGSPAILGEVPVEQHRLMIENARLKDELNRLGVLATKFLGRSTSSMLPEMGNSNLGVVRDEFCGLNFTLGLDFGNRVSNFCQVMPPNGPAMGMIGIDTAFNKSMFLDIALVAMDELVKLSQLDGPIWAQSLEGDLERLNLEEYKNTFSPCVGVNSNNLATEATRSTGTAILNGEALVETLMDANRWTEMFPWVIGSASTLDVISPGTGGKRNGAMLLMEAEFQVLSPLVPVRQVKFIRFCKQHAENIWAVVDVSIDHLSENASVSCRRLPSGCVIQDMLNGCSKVTWIEHTEYDENAIHQMYKPLIRSGMVFGAHKWISMLQKQCELSAVIMSSSAPCRDDSALTPNGKESIANLAQRMTRNFCIGVCATVHRWEIVQAENTDDTKLMVRKSVGDSGEPPGVILSAATTVWMPISRQRLFDFLQNENTRVHWDVLSQDGPMQQILHFSKSQDRCNSISILRASASANNANQNGVLILQDTYSDASGSLIVHAAVDTAGMNLVMSGADSSRMALLPSGFAIIPDCFPDSCKSGSPGSGSLLTIGFQILVNSLPASRLTTESADTIKSLIARTLQGIKTGLQCN